MKKIIPFRKDVIFKTQINDITSISLEHQLKIDDLLVSGEFIVSGEYKVSENSKTVEPFNLNISFENILDDKYDTSSAICDIDDFYYEIVDDKILSISIDVCIDKLSEVLIKEELPSLNEKKDIIEELFEEETNNLERCDSDFPETNKVIKPIEESKKIIKSSNDDVSNIDNKVNSLFSNFSDEESYVSYTIYIIRDGDTIDTIVEKYSIDLDEINKYNSITDLKIGDKIIIPNTYESDK